MTRTVLLIPLLLLVGACNGDFERMRNQAKYHLYSESSVFPDGKAMQHAPAHTVPVDVQPQRPSIDLGLVRLGQDRFNVYCAACHGVLGDGNTPVAAHMPLRQPPSLHEARIVAFTPDRLFTVITNGFGLMPSYAPELNVRERWAVVAYVRALQRSYATSLNDLPADLRQEARATLGGGRP